MKKGKLPIAPIVLGGFCLLLLLVFGMIWIVRKEEANGAVTTADPDKVRTLICTLPTDEAIDITFASNGQTVRLTLSDGVWVLSNDPETPVRQSAVTSLLSRCQTLLALREIGHGDLAEYGLDAPLTVLTLSCEKETYRLCFGDYNSSYDGYYFRLDGSDHIYIVENDLYLSASPEREDLLTLPELPDRSGLQSLTLAYPDGRTVTISGDPANARETDLLACLASLEISNRVDYGHASDKIYGLESPVTAELITSGGERLTLHFGRGESDTYTYLRIGQSAAVYVFTADRTDVLLSYLDEAA